MSPRPVHAQAPQRRLGAARPLADGVDVRRPRARRARPPEARRQALLQACHRDLYMRKHHSAASALLVRWLTAWTYGVRALAALVLPKHDAKRYFKHVTATCTCASTTAPPRRCSSAG